jgi:hypothetical protein
MNPSVRPTLVLFQGGVSASDTPLERLVAAAQNAATLDLLLRAAQSGAFASVILVTEDSDLASAASALDLEGLPLLIEPGIAGPDGFHFGDNLVRLCRAHNLERVVYVGGGAMPLGTAEALADLALSVSGASPCAMSNNLFSADMVAFYPASALARITVPATDNDLAWLLHYKAGLPYAPTTRSLATHFDIDTPTDIAVLHNIARSAPFAHSTGSHLSAFLSDVPAALPTLSTNVAHAYKVMSTRRAQVFLAGRISSWTWRRMEINLPCQTRVVSEERGMQASGRETRGEVHSLLGMFADLAGVPGLVQALETTSDASFLDTRVLFAHMGLSPRRADRFASDALMPDDITDPWVRDLTRATAAARIPFVLGGHSLIAGGVWALSERVRASASAASSGA